MKNRLKDLGRHRSGFLHWWVVKLQKAPPHKQGLKQQLRIVDSQTPLLPAESRDGKQSILGSIPAFGEFIFGCFQERIWIKRSPYSAHTIFDSHVTINWVIKT